MASDEEIDERERIPNDGIGTRVMQVRNKRRIRQTRLAHAVGVDQATIHRLENGDTQQVSILLLNKIAMHLKVSPDFLRYGPNEDKFADPARLPDNQNRSLFLETSVYRREAPENAGGAVNKVLSLFYSDEYPIELNDAAQLWVTGTNLRRIVVDNHLDSIRRILDRGGFVKVLMNHPKSKACHFAMIQDRGPGSDFDAYREDVHRNLSRFCELRETYGDNLQIRTIDYTLSFGLDVINGESETHGIIYVRFYPLPDSQQTSEDRPIVKLRATDAYWYLFFKTQFQRHWLEKAKKGLAEDVPTNYPWRSSWSEFSHS